MMSLIPGSVRAARIGVPDMALRSGMVERMFVSMDRRHELESLRRSLAMYPPGSPSGLDRERCGTGCSGC